MSKIDGDYGVGHRKQSGLLAGVECVLKCDARCCEARAQAAWWYVVQVVLLLYALPGRLILSRSSLFSSVYMGPTPKSKKVSSSLQVNTCTCSGCGIRSGAHRSRFTYLSYCCVLFIRPATVQHPSPPFLTRVVVCRRLLLLSSVVVVDVPTNPSWQNKQNIQNNATHYLVCICTSLTMKRTINNQTCETATPPSLSLS